MICVTLLDGLAWLGVLAIGITFLLCSLYAIAIGLVLVYEWRRDPIRRHIHKIRRAHRRELEELRRLGESTWIWGRRG